MGVKGERGSLLLLSLQVIWVQSVEQQVLPVFLSQSTAWIVHILAWQGHNHVKNRVFVEICFCQDFDSWSNPWLPCFFLRFGLRMVDYDL